MNNIDFSKNIPIITLTRGIYYKIREKVPYFVSDQLNFLEFPDVKYFFYYTPNYCRVTSEIYLPVEYTL